MGRWSLQCIRSLMALCDGGQALEFMVAIGGTADGEGRATCVARDGRTIPFCDISALSLLWCTAAFVRNSVVMCGPKPGKGRS